MENMIIIVLKYCKIQTKDHGERVQYYYDSQIAIKLA
jgi:hypothetical protein